MKKTFVFVCFILVGCAVLKPNTQTPERLMTVSDYLVTNTRVVSASSTPSFIPSPEPSATISPSSAEELPICSPLEGVSLEKLPDRVVNSYHPPDPGSDDPHHGVDLAEILPETKIAIAGLPVHAVLTGTVAGVIHDRFPYGNALIVETQLYDFPQGSQFLRLLPTPAPTLEAIPILTCPDVPNLSIGNPDRYSLYLLYAHLQSSPTFEIGESIQCGETIGVIGSSGNALNPHLHLETRLGPKGSRFLSMAHYDNSATPEEMATYCLWRVSGLFQMIDPLRLLK